MTYCMFPLHCDFIANNNCARRQQIINVPLRVEKNMHVYIYYIYIYGKYVCVCIYIYKSGRLN